MLTRITEEFTYLFHLYRWVEAARDYTKDRHRLSADFVYYLAQIWLETANESAYGECPYYLKEPNGTCSMSCMDEPACVTSGQTWPKPPTVVTLVRYIPDAWEHALENTAERDS